MVLKCTLLCPEILNRCWMKVNWAISCMSLSCNFSPQTSTCFYRSRSLCILCVVDCHFHWQWWQRWYRSGHGLLSGGEKQRPFWRHYYRDAHAVVFVVDSACSDSEMAVTRTVLHDALADPNLVNLPCLILANCQDKIDARTEQQVSFCLCRSFISITLNLIVDF